MRCLLAGEVAIVAVCFAIQPWFEQDAVGCAGQVVGVDRVRGSDPYSTIELRDDFGKTAEFRCGAAAPSEGMLVAFEYKDAGSSDTSKARCDWVALDGGSLSEYMTYKRPKTGEVVSVEKARSSLDDCYEVAYRSGREACRRFVAGSYPEVGMRVAFSSVDLIDTWEEVR